ncbi:hypothetical protein BDEG_24739 [Batrachochytrium dendrobatidis JEL423]|uniref:SGF29 C-terminal domain-containing protein n=1 Tax=Batrachochytrium dendrobatidis (strain JEL423) TaxID=403673 RepID=A0A177WLX1_BATDL|nr:hypothetical protein BDEG_24739 [Batrachochytrium dendrobatidis JEL423]
MTAKTVPVPVSTVAAPATSPENDPWTSADQAEILEFSHLPPLSNEELQLWQQVTLEMTALHAQRAINDVALQRMNKVHGKIADRQEAKEGFSVKAAVKLGMIYKDAIEKAEQELRVVQRAYDHLTRLISLRESSESAGIDSKRKKRRAESKSTVNVKRTRVSEVGLDTVQPDFETGDQVVAKIEEWILANMIGYAADKGKYEVEDAEEDDEKPGIKKRYFVSSKMLIQIPKDTTNIKEFSVKQKVLALFPSTTCFYQATVVLPPSLANYKTSVCSHF